MGTMSERVGAMGGNMGIPFDDGVFDGVGKIIVGKDWDCVSYMKIEYENSDGNFETREHGTIRGGLEEVIDPCFVILQYVLIIPLLPCTFVVSNGK